MSDIIQKAAEVKKALVGLVGFAATLATALPSDSPIAKYISIVIAVATLFGIYQADNAPKAEKASTMSELGLTKADVLADDGHPNTDLLK